MLRGSDHCPYCPEVRRGAADDEDMPYCVVVRQLVPSVKEDAYRVGRPAQDDAV